MKHTIDSLSILDQYCCKKLGMRISHVSTTNVLKDKHLQNDKFQPSMFT
jgi:DNA-directed RNA polymerase subunit N (RpoN/RPB10)